MPTLTDETEIDALIGRIYESMIDPQALPEVLGEIANLFDAHSALFFTPKRLPADGGISHILNINSSAFGEYINYYFGVDLWWQSACAIAVSGETGIVVGEELIEKRLFDRSEFYNDYLAKIDTYHVIANNTRVETHAGSVDLSIAFHGHRRHKGFAREHKLLLSRLLPHLRRAIYLAAELSPPMRGAAITADLLDNLAVGAMVLAANGRVVHANSVAERLLGTDHGISVKQGRLHASTAEQNTVLQALLLRASGATGRAEGGATVVRSIHEGAPAIVNLIPIPESGPMVALNSARILVTIRTPNCNSDTQWPLFAHHYRLTPAELRLCQALVRGNTVTEYCESIGITENTARTHLKSVFAKTGVRRQTELLTLITAFG